MRCIHSPVVIALPALLLVQAASAVPIVGGPTVPEYPAYVSGQSSGADPLPRRSIAGNGFGAAMVGMFGGRPITWDQSGTTPLPIARESDQSFFYPTAISGNGVIIGRENYIGVDSTLRWDSRSVAPVRLTGTVAGSRVNAYDINDSGLIVGTEVGSANDFTKPVRWEPGATAAVVLQSTANSAGSIPAAVNNAGVVIGSDYVTVSPTSSELRFVRWDATGAVTSLPRLTSATEKYGAGVKAINSAGMIAGTATTAGAQPVLHAVRWTPDGQIQELTPPSTNTNGTWTSYTNGINDAGVIIGISNGLPVRWDASGNPLLLQTTNQWSDVTDIDRAGTAIGNNGARPTIWRTSDGSAIDLASVLSTEDAGHWRFPSGNSIQSISDSGWISGFGYFDPDGAGPTAEYARLFLLDTYYLTGTPGDATRDGSVTFDDLLQLAQNYSTATGALWDDGDFTGDGAVSFDDLLALAQNYGGSAIGDHEFSADFAADWATAMAMVPEPASTATFAVATGSILIRRRRTM